MKHNVVPFILKLNENNNDGDDGEHLSRFLEYYSLTFNNYVVFSEPNNTLNAIKEIL